MKRILTEKQKQRKVKMTQLIIGLVLILVMVLSTVGYSLMDRTDTTKVNKMTYNGIEFIKDSNDYWQFNLDGKTLMTRFNPKEVSFINTQKVPAYTEYSNNVLYYDASGTEALSEIMRIFDGIVLRSQRGCVPGNECLGNYPIKNCTQDKVIIIREPKDNESESITSDNNCVYIISDMSNQTMFSDAFIFRSLRI